MSDLRELEAAVEEAKADLNSHSVEWRWAELIEALIDAKIELARAQAVTETAAREVGK